RWSNRSLGERRPFLPRQPSSSRSFLSPARRRSQRSRGRPPASPSSAIQKAACQSLAFRWPGRSQDQCSLRLSYRHHSLVFILSSETVVNSNANCVPRYSEAPRHRKNGGREPSPTSTVVRCCRGQPPRTCPTKIWLTKVGGVRSVCDSRIGFFDNRGVLRRDPRNRAYDCPMRAG